MNERIRELLDQTDIPQFPLFENSPPAWVASDYDMEKFAELIVKECIHELDMCRFEIPRERWMDERNDGIDFCVDTIKKTFRS